MNSIKVNDAAVTWISKLFSFLPQGIFEPVGHVNLHKRPSLSVMLGCAQGCVCAVVIIRRSNWNGKTVDKLKIAYSMVDFIRRVSW